MNFTREPIIESVITAKEGSTLLVRSSHRQSSEEYCVEAIEVVSFGPAFFFRCLERTNPFFLPVGHYEIVEVKENRMPLKAASFEKTIKIGKKEEGQETIESKKQRKSKKRRGQQHPSQLQQQAQQQQPPTAPEVGKEPRKLFPPPSKLIKEQMSKYRPEEETSPAEEKKQENPPEDFADNHFENPPDLL